MLLAWLVLYSATATEITVNGLQKQKDERAVDKAILKAWKLYMDVNATASVNYDGRLRIRPNDRTVDVQSD